MKPNARMQQKKKKMALYEVFSKGLSNSRHSKQLESLHAADSSRPTASPAVGAGAYSERVRLVQPKPRMVQLNRGRVEVSVRYDVAIVLALLAVLCVMGAYRLGERLAIKDAAPVQVGDERTTEAPIVNKATTEAVEAVPAPGDETAAAGGGDNWIVIATHPDEGQLAPVQQYLGAYGIKTQIRKIGGNYILHTKQAYDNPSRTGSDGWQERQRIIELGKKYEPMPGYRSFDFTTAYGMKKLN